MSKEPIWVPLKDLLHLLKEFCPILVTLLPIVTLERLVQPEKSLSPIFEYMIAVFKLVQFLKISLPKFVTPLPMVTFAMLVQ